MSSPRVIVVTGASVGIGSAILRQQASLGHIVVGLARRAEKIEVSFCTKFYFYAFFKTFFFISTVTRAIQYNRHLLQNMYIIEKNGKLLRQKKRSKR
jgi:hypothetical protein